MRKASFWYITGLLVLLTTLFWSFSLAGEYGQDARRQNKISAKAPFDLWAQLNINNVTSWVRADGQSNHSPGGDNGLYYPRGTKWVIYQDGLVYGGKPYVNAGKTIAATGQNMRVGGQTYNIGTREGNITGSGATAVAQNPADASARIYRIRRDYKSMSASELQSDAASMNEVLYADATQSMMDEISARYDNDWKNWPVAKGAPYIERNGVPGFQAPPAFSATFTVDSLIAGNYDEPGIAGKDPNSPADQAIWTVMNDLDAVASQGLFGSDPLGLEIQMTMWGYKRTDALGNLYFKRFKLINKGVGANKVGADANGAFYIDSMYIAQFSDPDLGNAGDDLAGCDTTTINGRRSSLGYVYNGNSVDAEYIKFNLPPPAAGYEFLAGPLVPSVGSIAIADMKNRAGFKNLPLTSFAFFAAGSSISDPPFTYEGAKRWYRMLQGYVPDPSTSALRLYPFPTGVTATKYPLAGDPTTATGFIDGQGTAWSLPPSDRRIVLNTGPFNCNPGDTQEIYVGTVAGIGADRLSSISVMKFNARFVRNTFDALFAVPTPPPSPSVSYTELDGKVAFEWGSNYTSVNKIENTVQQPGNFVFAGYNLYQMPKASSTLSSAKKVTNFFVSTGTPTPPVVIYDETVDAATGLVLTKPIQIGQNPYIDRSFVLDRDYVKDINKLNNGTEYYFAVTAYTRSTTGFLPAALESQPVIFRVTPQTPKPGTRFGAAPKDTAKVTQVLAAGAANSDGWVAPIVVDPGKLTGHVYNVDFQNDTTLGPVWSLKDVNTNTVLLKQQTNQTGDEEYRIVDGLMVKVSGPPLGMKSWGISGTRRFSPVGGSGLALEGFSSAGDTAAAQDFANGSMGAGYYFQFANTSLSASGYKNVVLKLAAVPFPALWDPKTAQADPNYSYGYRYLRNNTAVAGQPSFVPWIVSKRGGYDYQDYNPAAVPLSAWDVEANPPRRLAVGFLENNVAGGKVDGRWWPGLTDTSNTGSTGPREWLFIFDRPYTTTPDTTFTTHINYNLSGATVPLMWVSSAARRQAAAWVSGDEFRIWASHVNAPGVTYQFTAPTTTVGNAALATADVGRVNVFPNPYYAFNPQETSRLVKFVTFTKLPAKATVRIFNVAGQLVRTLEKNDPSQFFRWDLNNQDNFPVASGMYIVYIDMPDLGTTKTLKLGVIQEQEVPDFF